jgi:hypothetical protein
LAGDFFKHTFGDYVGAGREKIPSVVVGETLSLIFDAMGKLSPTMVEGCDVTYRSFVINVWHEVNRAQANLHRVQQTSVKVEETFKHLDTIGHQLHQEVDSLARQHALATAQSVDAFAVATKQRDRLLADLESKRELEGNLAEIAEQVQELSARLDSEFGEIRKQQSAAYNDIKTLNKDDLFEIASYRTPAPSVVNIVKVSSNISGVVVVS